jgi:hypothetical protein
MLLGLAESDRQDTSDVATAVVRRAARESR